MNFPKFRSAAEEEKYLYKLHDEGWTVDYNQRGAEQLDFNRLYNRCKKRRARNYMPPLFRDPVEKVLDFMSTDDISQNVPGVLNFENVPGARSFENVPGARSFEDVPGARTEESFQEFILEIIEDNSAQEIVLDIIEDEPEESDGRPEISEPKLHSNLDVAEVILELQVIDDDLELESEVVPEPEITSKSAPENIKIHVKRVVQLDWLLNSTEISAHEGVRYVSNRLAAKAREERQKK